MSETVLVVWTTLADEAAARELAQSLVEEGWVACAQIDLQPIDSTYPWKGEVKSERECRLTLKSRPELWDALSRRIGELHPYELPQVVAVDARATDAYADWVRSNTKRS